MYAFLVFILVLALIYSFYEIYPSQSVKKEGFTGTNTSEANSEADSVSGCKEPGSLQKPWAYGNVVAPAVVIPPVKSAPPVRNEGENPSSYDVPGAIPNAPYEQIGRNDPRPFTDPTLIKTNLPRIKEIAERLRGFLAFQAQLIADSSDPNIQLPLTQSRADLDKLSASINVYERNPGITPTETEQMMNEIEDNLWYLQNQVYKIKGLSPNQGTPAPLKGSVFEGFDNLQQQPIQGDQGSLPSIFQGSQPQSQYQAQVQPQTQQTPMQMPTSSTNYSQASTVGNLSPSQASAATVPMTPYASTMAATPASTSAPTPTPPASVSDLQRFLFRVDAESQRLAGSGSTDPITSARLNGLSRISSDVNDILNQVNNNQMTPAEIPITKGDVLYALKQIKQGQTPVLMSTTMSNNLPQTAAVVALGSTMPGILSKSNPMVKRILDNTTVSVGLNYKDSLGHIINTVQSNTAASASQESFLDYSLPPVPGDMLPPPRSLFSMQEPEITFDSNFAPTYQDPNNRDYIFQEYSALNGNILAVSRDPVDTACRQNCNSTQGCKAYTRRFGNVAVPEGEEQTCTLLASIDSVSTDPYSESGIARGPINSAATAEGFVGMSDSPAPFDPNVPRLRPEEARVLSGLVSPKSLHVGHFDWHERAKHIGDQIRKRGLDANSLGVLAPGTKVSQYFSWKGHAKMLCSRLEATVETGTAQACGCPPYNWDGWNV